jgi:hypothetical protein
MLIINGNSMQEIEFTQKMFMRLVFLLFLFLYFISNSDINFDCFRQQLFIYVMWSKCNFITHFILEIYLLRWPIKINERFLTLLFFKNLTKLPRPLYCIFYCNSPCGILRYFFPFFNNFQLIENKVSRITCYGSYIAAWP